MFPKTVQEENPKMKILNFPLPILCLAKFCFLVMAEDFANQSGCRIPQS